MSYKDSFSTMTRSGAAFTSILIGLVLIELPIGSSLCWGGPDQA